MTTTETDVESRSLIDACIAVCEDRQAVDVRAYDIGQQSTLADYCLICTGNSTSHINAIANNLDRTLREHGIKPRSMEGTPESGWILVDYADVLIHLFLPEARINYNIEGLMKSSNQIFPA